MGLDKFRNSTHNRSKNSGRGRTSGYKDISENEKLDVFDDSFQRTPGIFLGFIVGEGSFNISISTSDSHDKPAISAYFTIKVHEEDEILLKYFHQSTKLGNMNYREGRGYGKHVNWRISRKFGLNKLIDWIDKHSENTLFKHTSKYESYKIWKECVDMINEREHLTDEGIKKIARKRDKMNRDSRGRSADEIIEEFDL